MDDVTLTEEVLLEPAKVAVMLEGGPASTPSQQQGVKGGAEVQASALPLSMSLWQLSSPRSEPCPRGLCVQARWVQPFGTHLGSSDGMKIVTRKNGSNNNDTVSNTRNGIILFIMIMQLRKHKVTYTILATTTVELVMRNMMLLITLGTSC